MTLKAEKKITIKPNFYENKHNSLSFYFNSFLSLNIDVFLDAWSHISHLDYQYKQSLYIYLPRRCYIIYSNFHIRFLNITY